MPQNWRRRCVSPLKDVHPCRSLEPERLARGVQPQLLQRNAAQPGHLVQRGDLLLSDPPDVELETARQGNGKLAGPVEARK